MSNPQLAQDDRMAASSDFEVMLVWSLPSWFPEGRLKDWTERQCSDWAQLEASADPTRARVLGFSTSVLKRQWSA